MAGRQLLTARDLVIGEGATKVPLISCAEIDIQSGNIVGLHGPSGSGKSSLLRVLTARQASVAGKVFIDSQDLDSKEILINSAVAYLPT